VLGSEHVKRFQHHQGQRPRLHVLLGLHEHLASPPLTFWLPTGEWHISIGKATEPVNATSIASANS
jgi:hypothetical protein